MTMIEEALTQTTDTKACEIGPGATEAAAKMFRGLFPDAEKAVVIDDPRTRAVAGECVISLLKASGLEVSEHVINPDGSDFHATYEKVEEVREAFVGVPYMRARYFGADLVQRLGLMPALLERLFGAGGVWEVK